MTRALCPRCERPLSACICAWARPTGNEVEVLVLQHPDEQREAKNTARLLGLSLARCEIRIGEQFDPVSMAGTALLYPPEAGVSTAAPIKVQRLIVLDATWRKSRKMLHLNPWLLALPRVALDAAASSAYAALRKAQAGHQLATLEATVLALAQLENQPARYAPLLAAFEGFVAEAVARRS